LISKPCQTADYYGATSRDSAPAKSARSARRYAACSLDILNDIDSLGASLDSKIGDCVKLLSSLKQGGSTSSSQVGSRKALGVSMGTSLIGTVSKIIHELTEDTGKLAEIKTRLEGWSTESEPARGKYAYQPRKSTTRNDRGLGKTESSLSYDMPLQPGSREFNSRQRLPHRLPQQLNFISEDGASESLSKTTSRRVLGGNPPGAPSQQVPSAFSQEEYEQEVLYQ
jgi:hypothetical protein